MQTCSENLVQKDKIVREKKKAPWVTSGEKQIGLCANTSVNIYIYFLRESSKDIFVPLVEF